MINPTDQSLVEKMCITEFEIEHRKALILFGNADIDGNRHAFVVIGKE